MSGATYYRPFTADLEVTQPLNPEELPPSDALQNILQPNVHGKLVQYTDRNASIKGSIPTRSPPPGTLSQSQPTGSNGANDQTLMNLIDSQQHEIENYRHAMKQMGEEVVQMQDSLMRLEAENSRLRQQAAMCEDTTKAMMTDAQLEGMSKAEMLEKYVTLKRSLSQQVTDSANCREKLLHVQNELIKHNDREKQYLDQQQASLAQTRLLQASQERVKKLEMTCQEQERILEKLDKALKGKHSKQNVRFNEVPQVTDMLNIENARLKAELEHFKAMSAPKNDPASEAEKLKMQFRLEKAESRVSSLEKELLKKAKKWGNEKANISLRMESQRSLPPLPYLDRGKPHQGFDEPCTARSYVSRKHRTGYGTPSRLSPLY